MTVRGEREAVISGVGQSNVGRRIYEDPLGMTVDATLAAVEHAGLTLADIDGISTYPGNMNTPPGFSGVGVVELQDALRLELDWFTGGMELPGQLGAVANAIAAVSTGLASHVVCFRTVWEASAQDGSHINVREYPIRLGPGVHCARAPATILGTWGDDTITGTAGNDVIVAFGGNDRIEARRGHDTICAGPGHDVVLGGPGRDLMLGEGGNDRLFGGAGFADRAIGGRDSDLCVAERTHGCER